MSTTAEITTRPATASLAAGKVRWTDLAAVALILVVQCWVSWRSGSFDADLTHHPDEPAHFITGLMVHDYLTSALGQNPLAFDGASQPKPALQAIIKAVSRA